MELKQLDIFEYSEIENEAANQEPITESTESVVIPFETGDIVKLVFPTEQEDFELFNYLEHYYSHLKNKEGRIVQVMPYKKLQYQIIFNVKNEDNQLIMYHTYLKAVSTSKKWL